MEVELPETLPPPWYEQETIRGDFLRAIRQLQMNPDEPLVLGLVPGRARTVPVRWRPPSDWPDNSTRDAVLCQAAALGVDLLSGEEPARMRIVNLDVDGYGVWSGLKIERLAETLNVFHGPNEAGKTTLLQFIRSVLYGFSPERQRYLPPAQGGLAGGALDVLSPHGPFQISRHTAAGGTGSQPAREHGQDGPEAAAADAWPTPLVPATNSR